jgi:hypothetical protein
MATKNGENESVKDCDEAEEGEVINRVILNVDFNASHEIGCLGVSGSGGIGGGSFAAGKKHAWHGALSSAIDESGSSSSGDEKEECLENPDGEEIKQDQKKVKKVDFEVA